jgi:hypothetical protein
MLLKCLITLVCTLPEDGDCAETCKSKLTVKYTIYGFVHLLVLAEYAIQFTMLKMNSMKLTTLNLCLLHILSEKNVHHCRQV